MPKLVLNLFLFLILCGCSKNQTYCEAQDSSESQKIADSLALVLNWPSELKMTYFAGSDLTPSPACLAAAPTGEVFAGIDMTGSLGKDPDKGIIIKLIDCDNDGIADISTEFARVDNPRGIMPLGNRLFVLHSKFSEETGKVSSMDLVVFEDTDKDGVADGPSKPLIQNLSSPKFVQSRGADHATNGIRMGIDGWIYIAVGDFGFYNAIDRSGKELTMFGGGIVRVRADGKEMEIYTHGMRNIYDIAIDPYMNIFTRGNTNDGGGWNIRFSHHVQSGEYGYPVLFKHFTNEIIPALADLGGGSGTGALFLDDTTWPEKYKRVPMMADWGKNQLFIHRVARDGASFKQKQEGFIKLPQITDLDIDGSGRLYLSAWDGAGYKGDSSKGFIVRAVPKNWEYNSFPNLQEASVEELVSLLKSGSAVARLHAQQELISRPVKKGSKAAWKIAVDKELPLYARVAGIYTYAQIAEKNGIDNLLKLTLDSDVKEYALRALTDRVPFLEEVPLEPYIDGLKDTSERVQIAAIVGLGRLGRIEAAPALLEVPVPASFSTPKQGMEGPHATPNPSIIPAHVAVRALVNLNAVDACIEVLGSGNSAIALWALRYMHDPKAVEGLITAYKNAKDKGLKKEILITLSRLYKKEAPYDGSKWWGTRPDTHGPYYNSVEWGSSKIVKKFLVEERNKSNSSGKQFFADINGKHRMGIAEFGGEEDFATQEDTNIDLDKIRDKKGQIAKTSIEDVMLAIEKIKGDPAKGKAIYARQGCIACHSIDEGATMKGPFMGHIGSIMSREQIAESILKPNASISQGFATVLITTKDDKQYTGFISEESADKIVLRNISGHILVIKTENIITREELHNSIMPSGLANSLSYEEFSSLIAFLAQQKK